MSFRHRSSLEALLSFDASAPGASAVEMLKINRVRIQRVASVKTTGIDCKRFTGENVLRTKYWTMVL